MASCPFCRLAAEGLPAHGLYEDPRFVVILDKASLGFGHCMLIPKQHVVEVHELSQEVYVALFLLAKALAARLKAATGARAIGYSAFPMRTWSPTMILKSWWTRSSTCIIPLRQSYKSKRNSFALSLLTCLPTVQATWRTRCHRR